MATLGLPPSRQLSLREIEGALHHSGRLPAAEPLSRRYSDLIQTIARELGLTPLGSARELFTVVETIEQRRQKVLEAAAHQVRLLPAETPPYLQSLNRAERVWLRFAAKNVGPAVLALFDRQSLAGAPQERWLAHLKGAHPASYLILRRLRATNLPNLRPAYLPQDVPDYPRYACSAPWFPDKPAFSGMWPADMSKEELDFLRSHYSKKHPVLRPYTVVERLTPAQARRIKEGGKLRNPQGKPVEWIVKGEGGRWYRVVNMVFHEDFRQHFAEIAQQLRKSVQAAKKFGKLHPSFRNYVLTVAAAIKQGDFSAWLKADLEQTEGNLFFTFFPHEGYWPDNLKFPLNFETGVRDLEAAEYIRQSAEILAEQEREAAEIGQRLRVPRMTAPFAAADISRMVQVIWVYQKGAFMAAYPHAEVAGHDYPKVHYRGVAGHRNIVFADVTTVVASKVARALAQALYPQIAQYVTPRGFTRMAMWHEATHGRVGNRLDTLMRDGREMGEAYGDDWGVVAEPGADFGGVKTAILQYQRGLITRDEFLEIIFYTLHRAIYQLPTREQALDPSFLENCHAVGRTLLVGYLFLRKKPVIQLTKTGKLKDIDIEEFIAALQELNVKFLEFGLAGKLDDYMNFARKCVRAIPPPFLSWVHSVVGPRNRMYLVDRPGDRIAGVSWAA